MQLYKSEPKHEKPLDFFRNALGDSMEKNTQYDVMANKMKILEEQNDLLKSQNAELAKLQVILERFSCENMTIDDNAKENESTIAQDVEMRTANDDTNVAHASIKEEEVQKMESENCDFSNTRNSTMKENLDADMSEFEDSLFNTKVENQKLVPSSAQMVLEPADENVTEQPEPVATAVVYATFDATMCESERPSIPDEQNTSHTPKLVAIEIYSNSKEPETTAVSTADSSEQVATKNKRNESVSVSIIDRQSSLENASETFTFENDSEMPSESERCDSSVVTSIAEHPVSYAYELPTIVEETASALAPVIEENPNEETANEAARSPQNLECVSQMTPISPEPMPLSSAVPQLATMDNCESDASNRNQLDLDTIVSSHLGSIDSECTSIPNSQSSSVGSQNTQNSQKLDEIAEPIEMESEPIPNIQQHSSTLSAPESATTIDNESVDPCKVAAVNRTSADTLSIDTDTASIPASQQSLGSPESIITEIRTHIVDTVLNKFDECDQTDSAIPFVDESQANASNRNTLEDIDHYIRHDQGKQEKMAQSGYPADELKIEIDAPQPAMSPCEPISAQFNPSQIVSLDYTSSGNEILTLDVPVSHGTSSSMIFDLDTSLPLSQFSSDVGEESDYLLPPRQSGISFKNDGNISSFGSQSVLDTTVEYAADGKLNSSSSSKATINRSDDNLEMESNQSTLSQPANENPIDSVPEKNGKRKLSVTDDAETEFLLSKSRKPGVQLTPYSTN